MPPKATQTKAARQSAHRQTPAPKRTTRSASRQSSEEPQELTIPPTTTRRKPSSRAGSNPPESASQSARAGTRSSSRLQAQQGQEVELKALSTPEMKRTRRKTVKTQETTTVATHDGHLTSATRETTLQTQIPLETITPSPTDHSANEDEDDVARPSTQETQDTHADLERISESEEDRVEEQQGNIPIYGEIISLISSSSSEGSPEPQESIPGNDQVIPSTEVDSAEPVPVLTESIPGDLQIIPSTEAAPTRLSPIPEEIDSEDALTMPLLEAAVAAPEPAPPPRKRMTALARDFFLQSYRQIRPSSAPPTETPVLEDPVSEPVRAMSAPPTETLRPTVCQGDLEMTDASPHKADNVAPVQTVPPRRPAYRRQAPLQPIREIPEEAFARTVAGLIVAQLHASGDYSAHTPIDDLDADALLEMLTAEDMDLALEGINTMLIKTLIGRSCLLTEYEKIHGQIPIAISPPPKKRSLPQDDEEKENETEERPTQRRKLDAESRPLQPARRSTRPPPYMRRPVAAGSSGIRANKTATPLAKRPESANVRPARSGSESESDSDNGMAVIPRPRPLSGTPPRGSKPRVAVPEQSLQEDFENFERGLVGGEDLLPTLQANKEKIERSRRSVAHASGDESDEEHGEEQDGDRGSSKQMATQQAPVTPGRGGLWSRMMGFATESAKKVVETVVNPVGISFTYNRDGSTPAPSFHWRTGTLNRGPSGARTAPPKQKKPDYSAKETFRRERDTEQAAEKEKQAANEVADREHAEAERAQQTGQKRQRLERPAYHNPKPGTYGVSDEYLNDSSSDEESNAETPSKSQASRPTKRRRVDSEQSDMQSTRVEHELLPRSSGNDSRLTTALSSTSNAGFATPGPSTQVSHNIVDQTPVPRTEPLPRRATMAARNAATVAAKRSVQDQIFKAKQGDREYMAAELKHEFPAKKTREEEEKEYGEKIGNKDFRFAFVVPDDSDDDTELLDATPSKAPSQASIDTTPSVNKPAVGTDLTEPAIASTTSPNVFDLASSSPVNVADQATPPNTSASSTTDKDKEAVWTQAPPPRPTPAHASLPAPQAPLASVEPGTKTQATTTFAPFPANPAAESALAKSKSGPPAGTNLGKAVSPSQSQMDAIARQKIEALKHKPKVSSNLATGFTAEKSDEEDDETTKTPPKAIEQPAATTTEPPPAPGSALKNTVNTLGMSSPATSASFDVTNTAPEASPLEKLASPPIDEAVAFVFPSPTAVTNDENRAIDVASLDVDVDAFSAGVQEFSNTFSFAQDIKQKAAVLRELISLTQR